MDTTTHIQDIQEVEAKNSAATDRFARIERTTAVAATALATLVLILASLNAGPLWRDEANSVNLAQIPTFKDLWHNLRFDSCPLAWLLLLRAWDLIGFGGTDLGIRMLGLIISLGFLASVWVTARWLGTRAPVISLALLGSVPTIINIVGANRAYGLAMCFLVLTFGAIWRVVQSPSRDRIVIALVCALFFAHCLYYDVVFLAALLFAGAVIVTLRKEWKRLVALVVIGAVSVLSLLIYLPVFGQQSHAELARVPYDLATFFGKLSLAVTAKSSAQAPKAIGPEIWVWLSLALIAIAATVWSLWNSRVENTSSASEEDSGTRRKNADLGAYAVTAMICGVVGHACFLLRIQVPTQSWYYALIIVLCALALEAALTAPFPQFKPFGLARVGLVVLAVAWSGFAVFEECHTRRSNVDLIVQRLRTECREGDLILVNTPWEGITFDRYYHGSAKWMTIPPLSSHKLHRIDLIIQQLENPNQLQPAFAAIKETMAAGHDVWIIGHVPLVKERIPRLPSQQWLGAYFIDWSSQIVAQILQNGDLVEFSSSPVALRVNHLENLPLMRFRGAQQMAASSAASKQ